MPKNYREKSFSPGWGQEINVVKGGELKGTNRAKANGKRVRREKWEAEGSRNLRLGKKKKTL